MVRIVAGRHGESRLRMLRIVRRGDRHDARDLTVGLRFDGDFAAAFEAGRPDAMVPAETVRNLVHAAARDCADGEIEVFGLSLCERLLAGYPHVTRVRAEFAEQPWLRLEAGGKTQGQALTMGGPEQKTAVVTSNGRQSSVVSGIEDLVVMRTSGFAPVRHGAPDDRDAADDGLQRLLVGALSVRWTYATPDVTFKPYRQGVRGAVVDTFAWHRGRTLQQTLYGVGEVVLASYQEILDVTVAFRERPYRPADLFASGIENPDDLFVALEEPLAEVEVTVERSGP